MRGEKYLGKLVAQRAQEQSVVELMKVECLNLDGGLDKRERDLDISIWITMRWLC